MLTLVKRRFIIPYCRFMYFYYNRAPLYAFTVFFCLAKLFLHKKSSVQIYTKNIKTQTNIIVQYFKLSTLLKYKYDIL